MLSLSPHKLINNSLSYSKKKQLKIPPIKKSNEEFHVPLEELLSCEDLTRLPYLYDETVLECVTVRYEEDLIYTWAGPVLVAVNPCRYLSNLYSVSVIEKIHRNAKEGKDSQIPHVYSIAGLSHRRLVSQIGSVNQAVLVSGESGAGKTESARYLLKYLTHVEPSRSCRGAIDVQRRIVASNPLLEAFGNACTLRNQNSSRFGKLIRLQYQGNTLKGAVTDTYLLEKTRVTHQPARERNFHIFHQVLSGVKNGLLVGLEIKDGVTFRIIPVTSKKTEEENLEAFRVTLEAFTKMGISDQFQMELFKIVFAIMYLGNISFVLDDKKEAFVLSRDDICLESVETSASLLGIAVADLTEALTVRSISVVAGETTSVYRKSCEREEQCRERRDAFMQLLYVSVFSRLVASINDKTASKTDWSSHLGILDVYGFETFDENSLEQLCINYANERLQQEFTRRFLASEQRILIEEGFLDLPQLITDNSKCVSALDSPISVFSILNEECQLKRAVNEDSACERVCNALQNTGFVAPPLSPVHANGFVIKHYAGPVNYSSNGLLHKNKDEVPAEIVKLLTKSCNKFIADFKQDIEERESSKWTPGRKKKKITTLSKFKSSLDSLMKILLTCDLHYIRCVKPNFEGKPGKPDKVLLVNQLQANGILETVKISQAGYPVRLLYADFVRRYILKRSPQYTPKEESFVLALNALGDDGAGAPAPDKCRFGRKRIFLSESSLQIMEEIREVHRNNAATQIQKNIKRIFCRKKYLKFLAVVKSIQYRMRSWLIRHRFLMLKSAVTILQKNAKMRHSLKRYNRLRNAAVTIQKHIRGWLCRRTFRKLVQQTDLLVCSSRMSIASTGTGYGSTGYGSMVHSSLTDHSTSDIEAYLTDDVHIRRRICETEESGLESDTESLSGDGLKAGRTPKSKKERIFIKHPILTTDLSDTDVDDLPRRSSHLINLGNNCGLKLKLKAGSDLCNTVTASFRRPKYIAVANSTSEISSLDIARLRVATLRHLQEITGLAKRSRPSETLRIHLPFKNVCIYFKNGILSYRQMPKVSIKFHTRSTCLPYSTSLPHLQKPQGLIDAIR